MRMPNPAWLDYTEEARVFFYQWLTQEHLGVDLGYGIVLLVVLLVYWLKPGAHLRK